MRKQTIKGLNCISCGEVMEGVFYYGIRKVCRDCGGSATPQEKDDKKKK